MAAGSRAAHHRSMIDPAPPVPPVVLVREERSGDPSDAAAVRAVYLTAFPTGAEAKLLDALRASGEYGAGWSLVAEIEGDVRRPLPSHHCHAATPQRVLR
jgi:hypothetical protein